MDRTRTLEFLGKRGTEEVGRNWLTVDPSRRIGHTGQRAGQDGLHYSRSSHRECFEESGREYSINM
jgi:hypothetical protein